VAEGKFSRKYGGGGEGNAKEESICDEVRGFVGKGHREKTWVVEKNV